MARADFPRLFIQPSSKCQQRVILLQNRVKAAGGTGATAEFFEAVSTRAINRVTWTSLQM